MRSRRGLGGIIALILIGMLIAVLAVHFIYMRRVSQKYATLNEISGTRQRLLQLSKSLVRAGVIGFPSYNNYRLALINNMNTPIQFLGMVLTDSEGNSYVINSTEVPSIVENIDLKLYIFNGDSVVEVKEYGNVPQDIASGIFVEKSYILEVNLTTSIPIDYSRTYFVFTIPFTAEGFGGLNQPSFVPARKLYDNLLDFARDISYSGNITANVTPIKVLNLVRACGDHTETWLGPLFMNILPVYGNVTSYQILNGVYVSGNISSLNSADGNNLVLASSKTSSVVYSLEEQENNTIFYDDFQENPFSDGNLTALAGRWSWSTTYGLYDGGIYQSYTKERDGLFRSSEMVASTDIFATDTLSNTIYILTILRFKEVVDGTADIVFYYNILNFFEEIDAFCLNASYSQLQYWYWDNYIGWNLTASKGINVNITNNDWYVLMLRTDYVDQYTDLYVYNLSGSLLSSLSVGYPIYGYIGLGTYTASVYFDMLLISKKDPRFIIFQAPTGFNFTGWKIELYNASNSLIGSALFNSNGDAIVNVLKEPIIRNWTIKLYNSSGNLISVINYKNTSLDTLIGGNVYKITAIASISYSVSLLDTILINNSIYDLNVAYSFSSNVSGNYEILASPDNSSWYLIVQGTYNSPGSLLNGSDALSFEPENKVVYVKILFNSTKQFELYIDELNLVGDKFNSSTSTIFLVGCGNTNIIDVYNVSNGPQLRYWFSINLEYSGSPLYFDGQQDFSYDPVTGKLMIVKVENSKLYLYEGSLSSSPGLSLVYSNTTGAFTFENPKIEVFDNKVIIGVSDTLSVKGSVFMTLNESNGALLSSSSLSNYYLWDYSTSAINYYNLTAYFTTNTTKPYYSGLIGYSYLAGKAQVIYNLTEVNLVGSDYYKNGLWIAIEGGGFRYVNLSNGISVSEYNPLLPAVPIGPGDRLEVYEGYLILVRGDGTSDVLIIPMPS